MKFRTKAGVIVSAFFFLGLAGMQVYADETEIVEESTDTEIQNEPTITYYSHVSMIGDTDPVENGEMTGTEGKGLQMEALSIELDSGDYSGDIEYCAHVENIGWQDYVSSSSTAGTTGQGLQIEAVKIRLTDELAENYDVYYSAHIADYGWLGWAVNDQSSGSAGYGKQMEALKILIQKKGVEAPVSTTEAFVANQLTYQAHVSNIGWMNPAYEGNTAGTTGQGNGIEALNISLDNAQYDGNIECSAYVKGEGWQDYVSAPDFAGTVGQGKALEAIKVRLTGDIAEHYDIYYRVHSSNFGWQGWTCNDKEAGTLNYGEQLEAVELQLISKYETAPKSADKEAFVSTNLSYEAHVSNIGWMNPVFENQTAGTVGQGKGIEALKITLGDLDGEILYKSYAKDKWEDEWKSQGDTTGTTGIATCLEAIQIKLSDSIASLYNIFYRVHVSGLGWLDWVKDGALTGTVNQNRNIEAIEITLDKNNTSKSSSTISYGEDDIFYVQDAVAEGWQKIYGYDYYFEEGKMAVNCIVDGKAIGPEGIVIPSVALEYARSVLNTVGWNLRAAYDWVVHNNTYFSLPIDPSLGSDWYAQFLFENGQGNCYAFAAAVYEMGSLLGYDIHHIAGNYLTSEGELPHSWVEVVIDGDIYILDANFEEETHLNGYMLTYGAPRTLRYYEWYRMN